MFAVVETGGKQYKVSPGQTVEVEKLPALPGDTVELGRVLLISTDDNQTLIGSPTLEDAKIVARVKLVKRGPKIVVFRYKSKSRYRRKTGHRQDYTTLTIEDIWANGASLLPAKAEEEAPTATEEEAAEGAIAEVEATTAEATAAEEAAEEEALPAPEPPKRRGKKATSSTAATTSASEAAESGSATAAAASGSAEERAESGSAEETMEGVSASETTETVTTTIEKKVRTVKRTRVEMVEEDGEVIEVIEGEPEVVSEVVEEKKTTRRSRKEPEERKAE